MGRSYYTLSLDYEMHWHCEDNGHIWSSYLSKSCVMRCFGIVRTIPTSSSSWSMDHTFDLMVCILSFLKRLWLSLWGRHCFETTLVYIVDWLLQCSKDFSDTTVFGWWTTLTMSNRTFYSTLKFEAVRCYLYVESWFEEGTLRSDYVLHTEEDCTDTLCESLRSWEVSQLVTNELVIHVWMRTSLIWELLEVFRCFWIHLVESEFCRLVAAGIVSTNLYLKNLRFVNWKPGIEFTSWDIGSKDWCQKFIWWTRAAVSHNLT